MTYILKQYFKLWFHFRHIHSSGVLLNNASFSGWKLIKIVNNIEITDHRQFVSMAFSLTDIRGRQGRVSPFWVQILSFSCSFWKKLFKIIDWWSHLGGWRPLSGKTWIRHWKVFCYPYLVSTLCWCYYVSVGLGKQFWKWTRL